jgi:3-phenylpropionate/trans-cinnamate dioxygenase ferredoxin component
MPEFVRVATLSEIPPGKMLAVRVEREDVVLYNVAGAVYASRDFCPHAGFALSKSMFRGKYVRCSLHSWEFDVTNGEYTGNPHVHLRSYSVKVEGEDVFVDLAQILPARAASVPGRGLSSPVRHIVTVPGDPSVTAVLSHWRVNVGDSVKRGQPLAELVSELPSPVAGRVAVLHVAEGATVRGGDALITFEDVT